MAMLSAVQSPPMRQSSRRVQYGVDGAALGAEAGRPVAVNSELRDDSRAGWAVVRAEPTNISAIRVNEEFRWQIVCTLLVLYGRFYCRIRIFWIFVEGFEKLKVHLELWDTLGSTEKLRHVQLFVADRLVSPSLGVFV